ncbi:MAG: GtrA family protein [Ruminococcaceae bacterium]|nr:GtrA family protein [Oscillospiraceae bacterium]
MERIKEMIRRRKQLILYLLFGAVTTVCSLLACYITLRVGVVFWHDEQGDPTAGLDILGSASQWVVGVLVAFVTNKKWVFTDAEHGRKATWKQLGTFSGSRVFTFVLEAGINLGVIALLEALHYPSPAFDLFGVSFELSERIWAKVVSSVVVVFTNYYISKLFVFRKKDEKTLQTDDCKE